VKTLDSGHGAGFQNAMRVFEPNDFMVLHEVETVDAKATKRFVELSCGCDLRTGPSGSHSQPSL